MIWWLSPSRLVFFLLVPVFLACSFMGRQAFAVYNHPANYIEGDVFWLGLAGLLLFSAGAFFAETRPLREKPDFAPVPVAAMDKALSVFFFLAIASALLFLSPALAHPALVMSLASGTSGAQHEMRDTLYQVPGVTSFVSMQSLCVVLVACYARWTGGVRLPDRFRWAMAALVVLCLLRAWLWSERLAFLELVLPAVVCLAPSFKGRAWLFYAPLLGILGVFVLFSFGEYFRTWQEIKSATDMSFVSYVTARFAGYYATALNNGAAIVRFLEPVYAPVNTAQWFYKFPLWPLVGLKLDGSLVMAFEDWFAMMSSRTNVAFTNPSGLFMPFYDLGPALGLALWLLVGAVSGFLARAMQNGVFVGRVLYPVWYVGILEILRIFYWGYTRFFPVFLAALLLARYLKHAQEKGR